MSQSMEDDESARPSLKLPVNVNGIKPLLSPPVELSTATDIRFNKYCLCTNLRFLHPNNGNQGGSLEAEQWTVELFGNMEEFLVPGKDGMAMEPCDFMTFFRRMLYELRHPNYAQRNVTIWIQHHLGATPSVLTQDDNGWITALQDYEASFLLQPGHSTIWFYFQFTSSPRQLTAPSEGTIRQVVQGLSPIPVDMPPEEHDDSQDVSTRTPSPGSPKGSPPGPAKLPQAPKVNPTPAQMKPLILARPTTGAPHRHLTILQGLSSVPQPQNSRNTGTRAPSKLPILGGPLPVATSLESPVPTAGVQAESPVPAPVGTRAPHPSPATPKAPSPVVGPSQDPKTASQPGTGLTGRPVRIDSKKVGIVGRLRRASITLKSKVKEGLRSPPIISAAPELARKSTILTELASQAREGGVDDPDGLLPCTQQPDQEEFFRYCSGYLPGVDPDWRDNVRNIRLRNCKLAVTPHQFCTAVRILFAESNTGIAGGLLASAPGTGKTYIILFAYALRELLFASRRDCMIEWAETDRELHLGSKRSKKYHLPRDAPRGRGQPCPSQKPGFGVCCYCVPDGLSRLTVDKLNPGVTLVQVPNGAMPSWLNAIKDAKFEPSVYNMAVFLHQDAMPDGLRNNLGAVEALKRGIKNGAFLPGQHNEPLAKNYMALESYCLLTSHHSSAVDQAFQSGSQPPQDNVIYALTGLTFFDESHQALDEKSKPVQTAQILRHYQDLHIKSDIWHVTATPFGAKFEDVMAAMKTLAPQLTDHISTLSKSHELAKSSEEPSKHVAFESQFRQVFNDKLVIRDVVTTRFMGRPITDIQSVEPTYISSVAPEDQRKFVQDFINSDLRERLQVHLNKGIAHVNYLGALRAAKITNVLYFLSLFPSMAEALTQNNLSETVYLDYKLSELIRSLPDTTGEALSGCQVLTDAVDMFAQGPRSPKVRDIIDELKRLFHDPTERPESNKEVAKWPGGTSTRADLTLKKTVIITPTFTTAVFLYLYLHKYHPSYHPLLYHRDLKGSAKSAVIKNFDSLKKDKDTSRVFIAPASVAGTGLNLQVANRLILTSPLLNKSDETQSLARVNRMGQTLKVGVSILVSEDSPIDRIVVADRARRPIISDPLNLDEDLKVHSDSEHNNGTPLRDPALQPVALGGTVVGAECEEYISGELYD